MAARLKCFVASGRNLALGNAGLIETQQSNNLQSVVVIEEGFERLPVRDSPLCFVVC